MKQKILRFTVHGQELTSHPVTVVADSRNYLTAAFTFGSEWEGIEKTAVFQAASGAVYHMLVQDGVCRVPEEVIRVPWFRVSVFGGDRLTTNRAEISVCQSGFLPGVTPPEPTPDIYDQLLSSVAAERAQAAASADAAEAARQEATADRIETQTLAEQAAAAAETAGTSAAASSGYAANAAADALRAAEAAALAEQAAERTDTYTKPEADGRFAAILTGHAAGSPAVYRDALEGSAFRRLAVLGTTVETGVDDKMSSNPYTFAGIQPSVLMQNGTQDQLVPFSESQTAAGVNLVPGESGRVTLSGTAAGAALFQAPAGSLEAGSVTLSAGGRLPAGVTLSLISEAGATLAQVGPGQGEATAELAAALQAHVTLSVAAGTGVAATLCLSLEWRGTEPDKSIPVPVSTALYGMPDGPRDEWDAVTGCETRRCRLVEPGESSEVTVSEDPAIGSSHVGFNLTIPHKHTGIPEADVLCTHFVSKATGSTIEDIAFSLDETRIQLRMRTRILSLYGYDAGDPTTTLPAFRSWIAAQKGENTPLQLVVVRSEEEAVSHAAADLYPIGRDGMIRPDDGEADLLYNRDLDAVMDRYARAIETAGGILSS